MLLAVIAGALFAWLGYRGRLTEPLARLAAFARLIATAALLLLVIDPGVVGRLTVERPIVLLDRSVSMWATGGRAAEAAALAASLGDTISFGELAPGIPGGTSHLAELLPRTLAGGRAVIVVTDGEISDTTRISADSRRRVSVRTLARPIGNDLALTSVRAPERLTVGDTLAIEIEARRIGSAPDSVRLEVRDSATVLAATVLRFGSNAQLRAVVSVRLPVGMTGARWLEVGLVGVDDTEPGDDIRWLRVMITATPGIVVLATSPDWDARALYRTLKDVADAPVAGFAQLQVGRWFRMADLKPVAAVEVMRAARAADLLAVRGNVMAWQRLGRSRLLWPSPNDAGDWFISPRAGTPLGGAFAGLGVDSLPPLVGARAVPIDPATGWIAATARRSRRGAEVPVMGGTEASTGRTIWFGVDGLSTWSSHGGASEQAWRALVADATTWLLATSQSDSFVAKPLRSVTPRGRAVRFKWLGSGGPVPQEIQLTDGAGVVLQDSLRFDGAGEASLPLPVGRYAYHLPSGGSGTLAVEPYDDELVPSPVTLSDQAAEVEPASLRQSWREVWWLFALAVICFGVEWGVRRRMGAA